MSGLSKVERQRAKIKRLEIHLETWQAWARGLLSAPPEASGPAMRQQIQTVWEATRDVLDGPKRVFNVNGTIVTAEGNDAFDGVNVDEDRPRTEGGAEADGALIVGPGHGSE